MKKVFKVIILAVCLIWLSGCSTPSSLQSTDERQATQQTSSVAEYGGENNRNDNFGGDNF